MTAQPEAIKGQLDRENGAEAREKQETNPLNDL
jgi:hypothetical protein